MLHLALIFVTLLSCFVLLGFSLWSLGFILLSLGSSFWHLTLVLSFGFNFCHAFGFSFCHLVSVVVTWLQIFFPWHKFFVTWLQFLSLGISFCRLASVFVTWLNCFWFLWNNSQVYDVIELAFSRCVFHQLQDFPH